MANATTSSSRIGQRHIAIALKVSPMTVSLALRNQSGVSESTRRRVQAAADKMGYRPDPEMTRLMARLTQRRGKKSSVTIALVDLTINGRNSEAGYHGPVAQGARERAARMGFEIDSYSCHEMSCRLPRLLKILKSRGVRGMVLLPPIDSIELPPEADWSDFSVVNTSFGITPDLFNRVAPHNFIDMCRVLKRLESAGFRRIGFVFERGFDERSLYQFTAAIHLQDYGDCVLRIPPRAKLRLEHLTPWLRAFRPEIVLTHCAEELHPLIQTMRTPPMLYSVGVPRLSGIPFWDQKPSEIGTHAVTLLAGMIRDSERGIPAQPATTLIHGEFRDNFNVPADAMSDRLLGRRAHRNGLLK
jgi:hypothetical protein